MRISVLVTVHNRFELLRSNLISLSHQSLIPDEVVVSDDGSEQNIAELLQPLANRLPFNLKYVRQVHKGFRAARARNNAANYSTGEFLIFLDQDIIGTHGFIETFAENAKPGEFRVAWPIRLTEEQTVHVTDEMLASGDFTSLVSKMQMFAVGKQFRKELLYSWMHTLNLRKFGTKLRSGLFSVFRSDYFKVNGFDEMYRGWGNEDDDLGQRFHVAGILGRNPFLKQFPLHLYHEPNRRGIERPNLPYYSKRVEEIHKGDFRCRYGVENPLDKEYLTKLEIGATTVVNES